MVPAESKSIEPQPAEDILHQPRTGGVESDRKRLRILGACGLILVLAFAKPLLDFLRFALAEDRNSYLLLVPAIASYLVWIRRQEFRSPLRSSLAPAIAFAIIGAISLMCAARSGTSGDRLSIEIFSFLCFWTSACFGCLGASFVREIAFPLGFLIFSIPMPAAFASAIEIGLQHASAEAAYWMLTIAQAPMLRQGLEFLLPGITIRVAQECSGYNSSCALFLVSLVAGHMFLKSPLKRTWLALAVLPLAILRNGFRITTIALLCVHVGPHMIDSPIHHRGGPIFFALSLIPFFALLWLLRRLDRPSLRPIAAAQK